MILACTTANCGACSDAATCTGCKSGYGLKDAATCEGNPDKNKGIPYCRFFRVSPIPKIVKMVFLGRIKEKNQNSAEIQVW